jgi:hypothetical protein
VDHHHAPRRRALEGVELRGVRLSRLTAQLAV